MAATHKRFDSDDDDSEVEFHSPIQEVSTESTLQNTSHPADGDSESSGDEAPEAVSTSAALESSRSAARKLAETRHQADKQERAKRQKLDRARVKQTKARRKAHEREKAEIDAELKATAAVVEADSGDEELETEDNDTPLLPASLIAAAERDRQAAEALAFAGSTKEQKRKLNVAKLTRTTRPKDVHAGNTTIRVLPSMSLSTLPPRATPRAGVAKTAWLKNKALKSRAGNDGVGPRKPWKKGFLVKNR